MGITIHYRGKMDDTDRICEMEDRVMDLVFAFRGKATVWRSYSDHDRSRVVRGLLVEMSPGQDTLSLLVSPEGYLTPLYQIEQAEESDFDEPPDCFVKTQFGSLLGHVAIVHLLDAIKAHYASNLEIIDEGEYYETRDLENLRQKQAFLAAATRSMAEGLRNHGLSHEAMEDPDIVAKRIERIAALVQTKLNGEAVEESNLAASAPSDDLWHEPSLEEDVEWMESQRRKNDARTERMVRRIADASSQGIPYEEAFRMAMREEGLHTSKSDTSFGDSAVTAEGNGNADEEASKDEFVPPPHPFDEAATVDRHAQHPAVELAATFFSRATELQDPTTTAAGFYSTLSRGAMDMVGGLAQATGDGMDDRAGRAVAITQLKRALFGHGLARGAVFGLRSEDAITQQQSKELHEQLGLILTEIHALTSEAWEEPDW